ncbi:MAG: hypothetical protein M9921_12495 [Fimbriimonadaceae bacterium]|nr:hypothetical protein [Fimbriimonadaceae bacterium]
MATPGTDFEKPRGISRVEVRRGFAMVHVGGLAADLAAERLKVLRSIAESSVSIDFVKLTHGGVSFLVAEDRAPQAEEALRLIGAKYTLGRDRAVVIVHAVNMRDEEGLIAGIVRKVIASGVRVDHLGDMHDRVLLVMDAADVPQTLESFREGHVEVAT